MANFCGGFNFDETLKVDKGIITIDTGNVDTSNVVTACSQLFDGAVFKVIDKTITSIEAEEVMNVLSVCGTRFDTAYFSIVGGKLKYTAPTPEEDEEELGDEE